MKRKKKMENIDIFCFLFDQMKSFWQWSKKIFFLFQKFFGKKTFSQIFDLQKEDDAKEFLKIFFFSLLVELKPWELKSLGEKNKQEKIKESVCLGWVKITLAMSIDNSLTKSGCKWLSSDLWSQ